MIALPEKFENVTVDAKSNVYFDGKVISHTIYPSDGQKKTLGVILPGSYHFGTASPEKMEITSGVCKVKIDGSDHWSTYSTGESFEVPGNSAFDIAVDEGHTDYICTFLS